MSPAHQIFILIIGALFLVPFPSLSISLPDKIGRLNDYGNILIMEDQKELERKINRLESEEIGLTILISTRDPYLNPDIFASKIRAKWDLRGNPNESFIVFVSEQNGWAIRTFFTTTLLNLFSPDALKDYQKTLKKKAENGDIRSGTLYAVNTVYEKAFTPKREPKKSPEEQDGFPLFYLLGGIAGGIILLALLVRWEAMRRCPHCGSRLNTSKLSTGTSQEIIKSCPDCGYSETE